MAWDAASAQELAQGSVCSRVPAPQSPRWQRRASHLRHHCLQRRGRRRRERRCWRRALRRWRSAAPLNPYQAPAPVCFPQMRDRCESITVPRGRTSRAVHRLVRLAGRRRSMRGPSHRGRTPPQSAAPAQEASCGLRQPGSGETGESAAACHRCPSVSTLHVSVLIVAVT